MPNIQNDTVIKLTEVLADYVNADGDTMSGALTVNSSITANAFLPDMTGASGNVSTRDIGSPTAKFNAIYADEVFVGASSLYVNNKKVIEDVSNEMTFQTSQDQGLVIKTTSSTDGSGNGNLTLQSENEINATALGGFEWTVSSVVSSKHMNFSNSSVGGNITLTSTGSNSQIQLNASDEIDLTAPTVDLNGNLNVSGVITGTLGGMTELVQDVVGAMVSGNTESDISVSYNDSTGKLNFDVADSYVRNTSDSMSGTLTVNHIDGGPQNLIITAGEMDDHLPAHLDGVPGEFIYLGAEWGLQVWSSSDNLATGIAGTHTATVLDSAGNSTFPGTVYVGGNLIGPDTPDSKIDNFEKVFNAVWNDIADFIEVEDECIIEAGKCYYITKDFKHEQTSDYQQKGTLGIASDTYGYGLGKTDGKHQLPIAVGGFVLAYIEGKPEPGDALCSAPNGKLAVMSDEYRQLYPERIVATYYKPESVEEYHGIQVNGRHWVKVK